MSSYKTPYMMDRRKILLKFKDTTSTYHNKEVHTNTSYGLSQAQIINKEKKSSNKPIMMPR